MDFHPGVVDVLELEGFGVIEGHGEGVMAEEAFEAF